MSERASGFINSLISSLAQPNGERWCTLNRLSIDGSKFRTNALTVRPSRARKEWMRTAAVAIRIQKGNFDTANGRTDGRTVGLTNAKGYETHFGLGAKVDLIESCQSFCLPVSQ